VITSKGFAILVTARLKNQIIPALLTLIAGCILPFAFAPYHLFILAPITIAILFYFWQNTTPWQAAFRGFTFGIGMYGFGISWVYISIHHFGGFPMILAISITALFVLILSLFPMIQGYCLTRWYKKHNLLTLLIVFPASWVLLEWIRGWIFTGFPWLYLGYSQATHPLSGYAPILGIYGTSFLVALSASLLVAIITSKNRIRYSTLFLLLIIWIGGFLLKSVNWTYPVTKPISVSIVQGNIPQTLKWQPEKILPTIDLYEKLTTKHLDSQLIIWPEAAVTLALRQAKPYLKPLIHALKRHHTSLIAGIPIATTDAHAPLHFYNAAIVLGNGHGIYYKRHLVPFGEYLPFEYWLLHHATRVFIRNLGIPIPISIPGPKKQPLLVVAQHILIAPYICYEIAYAELVRHDLPKAQALITMTDDAWFGHSAAAAQHLQIGQFRSIETGRYMLFATNNGISAIVNAKGNIVKTIPRFKTDVLSGHFYAMKGETPWVHIGTWPIMIALIALLLLPFLIL